jgi:GNAT superfamily N-acetyltransferase
MPSKKEWEIRDLLPVPMHACAIGTVHAGPSSDMISAMDGSSQQHAPHSRAIRVEPVAVDRIINLRHQVLRQGLPREEAIFEGDRKADALHVGAFDGDRLVGCVTLHASTWEEQPAWQLRGMAVAPGYQKSGIGRALLAAVDEHVALNGNQSILWCNARVPAAQFYQKHGWQIVSEVFEIPTAGPHVRMVKRTPNQSGISPHAGAEL